MKDQNYILFVSSIVRDIYPTETIVLSDGALEAAIEGEVEFATSTDAYLVDHSSILDLIAPILTIAAATVELVKAFRFPPEVSNSSELNENQKIEDFIAMMRAEFGDVDHDKIDIIVHRTIEHFRSSL